MGKEKETQDARLQDSRKEVAVRRLVVGFFILSCFLYLGVLRLQTM